jgi:hypothetical protein
MGLRAITIWRKLAGDLNLTHVFIHSTLIETNKTLNYEIDSLTNSSPDRQMVDDATMKELKRQLLQEDNPRDMSYVGRFSIYSCWGIPRKGLHKPMKG